MHEQTGEESRRGKRLYWLENVFWYHYKWYYFAGVFAAVLLVVSLVSWFSRVKYDWTVQFVHQGGANEAQVSQVQSRLEAVATDETGNGRVQVQVLEHCDRGEPGRQDLFGLLRDGANILYVVDEGTLEQFRELGYFDEAAALGQGLWVVVWDGEIVPYTQADFEGYGYTDAQIAESNAYRVEQHQQQVEAARRFVGAL